MTAITIKRYLATEANNAKTDSQASQSTALILGRTLYSLVFLVLGVRFFSQPIIDYATRMGLIGANFIMPLGGLFFLVAGLSILVGYRVRYAAMVLIAVLTPTTLILARFWGFSDPLITANQEAHFLKNLALIGAAFLLIHYNPDRSKTDFQNKSEN